MLSTKLVMIILTLIMSIQLGAQDNTLTKKERAEGWKLLFDGKTTNGWRGAFLDRFPEKGWNIENGILMVAASGGSESTNGGDIITENDYGDFELLVDFKLTEGANSGIKYFVDAAQPRPANPKSAIGLEYQILDDEKHPDAKLGKNGNRTLASLYDLIPAINSKPVRPIGEWNTARIISRGNRVEHWLNGIRVLHYERSTPAFEQLVAESKYKNMDRFGLQQKGRILLQDHGDRVFFRNIKIRTNLPPLSSKKPLLKETPGIVSYTFRNSFQRNVAGTLDTIKAMGITNIEFSNLFGKSATEIKQMLDARGMQCTSFGTGYNDLTSNLEQVAQHAKALGASFVRVAWIPFGKEGFTIETAKKAVADFTAAGKILKEKHGLTFCYHNHGYEFQPYKDGTLFDYIVQNTDPEYVSFELDILWVVHPGADPVALLKKYGSRIKLMHVKDLRKGVVGNFSGSTPIENDVTVGTGQLNIPAVLRAAQKSGIRYYYIEDESPAAGLQVPLSLRYLQELIR